MFLNKTLLVEILNNPTVSFPLIVALFVPMNVICLLTVIVLFDK